MDGPRPPTRGWSARRVVLTLLGVALLAFGLLVTGYGLVVTVTRPLLFIVGVPFAIFGLAVAFVGALLVGGTSLRERLRRRRAA